MEKKTKKQPKQSFFFSSTLRPFFPSFIYTFVCWFFFRFNTIPYWQLIQHRFRLAIKWMEVWIRSNMPHYNALVPSLVWCWIYLNERLKTNKVNIDLLNSSINRLSTNRTGSNSFLYLSKRKKKIKTTTIESIAIDLHINTFTFI